MIISKTPNRISFLGGGSDYPSFFHKHGGLVIGAAIDKYSYICLRRLPPFFDYKNKFVYSQIETSDTIADIQHRAIKKCLEFYKITDFDDGVELHHISDLPSGTGIGSSSTFIVGVLNALATLQGEEQHDKRTLASEAIYVEQELMKETVGCQDQIWAAFGGINIIEINKEGRFIVTPLTKGTKDLEQHISLFFTGFSRSASSIASSYVQDLPNKPDQLNLTKLACAGMEAIFDNKFPELGKLISKSWELKKSLSPQVTNQKINEIYNIGMKSGAYGGKLIGSGGGGMFLFICPPEKKMQLSHSLPDLLEIDVKFDMQGSTIIVNQES